MGCKTAIFIGQFCSFLGLVLDSKIPVKIALKNGGSVHYVHVILTCSIFLVLFLNIGPYVYVFN